MAFRILSIDGGGLRGIIPLLILEHVLKFTKKQSIADCFDLITGTSTGGIIACALSLKEKGLYKYTIEDIKQIYTEDAQKIFPQPYPYNHKLNLWSPKYEVGGLEKVLFEQFGEHTLQDCKTPLFIPAYNIRNYEPFYYTSRYVNPTSKDSLENTQFRLTDICRSTSAAPTYFPSHHLSYSNNDEVQVMKNLIDGGVFVNNPSLAAIAEVMQHAKDPLYSKGKPSGVRLDEIHIMSIGTGFGAKTISHKNGTDWGRLQWAPRLFDIMMQGNSQSVHHQVKTIIGKKKYIRLNVMLPDDCLMMDDGCGKTREQLIAVVNEKIINNSVKSDRIEEFAFAADL